MAEEIVYMLGIVGVGFAVNYLLRALPFLLFAGRDRVLPRWVEKLGKVISPVIIAGLIVYAYSGSAWRTPWPYLAGGVTVALHLWKRNPLLSIVVGTALYMFLLSGCKSTPRTVGFDAQHPAITVTTTHIAFGDEKVDPMKIPDLLSDLDVPKTRTIHIRIAPDVRDLTYAKALMALLAREGYTRPVLVTDRHAEAESVGKNPPKRTKPPQTSPRRVLPPSASRALREPHLH